MATTKEGIDSINFIIESREAFYALLRSPDPKKLKSQLIEFDTKLKTGMSPQLRQVFTEEFLVTLANEESVRLPASLFTNKDFSMHDKSSSIRTLQYILYAFDLILLSKKILDTTHDIIVLSIGSEGDTEQQKPKFVENLANTSKAKILVINIDPHFLQQKPEGYFTSSITGNIDGCYFGTYFGNLFMEVNRKTSLETNILSDPLNEATKICNKTLEKLIQQTGKDKKTFIFQSFLQPFRIPPFVHSMAVKYNDRLGETFEVITGYDRGFPPLHYSKAFFTQFPIYDNALEVLKKEYTFPNARDQFQTCQKKLAELNFGNLYRTLQEFPDQNLLKQRSNVPSSLKK